MPFARPTLSQLRGQVLADIAASDLPNADSLLRRAVLRVLATAQAGLAHLHFGYLDWIARQAIPYSATDEYAEGWAALVGISRKPETTAAGLASFPGAEGAFLPAGTLLSRGDGGAYSTAAGGIVSVGFVTVAVTAVAPGVSGNADAGTVARLATAVPGVVFAGTVSASGGEPAESDDALKARYLEAFRAPAQGGDAEDYRQWTLAVPGVTRAWVFPHLAGPGTVSVFAMFDAGGLAGFPSGKTGCAGAETRDVHATGDMLGVADAIFPRQPVTALVYACRPAPFPFAFVINDLALGPVVGGAAAISAALADALLRHGNPLGRKIAPSEFEAAIAAVPGVGAFTLAAPAVPVSAPVGSILTVGSVAYGASA